MKPRYCYNEPFWPRYLHLKPHLYFREGWWIVSPFGRNSIFPHLYAGETCANATAWLTERMEWYGAQWWSCAYKPVIQITPITQKLDSP